MFELTDEIYVKTLHYITLTAYPKLHEEDCKHLGKLYKYIQWGFVQQIWLIDLIWWMSCWAACFRNAALVYVYFVRK